MTSSPIDADHGGEVVAGIDGCRQGWVVVEFAPSADDPLTANVIEDLAPLLRRVRTGTMAAVAIDMPIGLLDRQPRRCDTEARKLLGPRSSSVFPCPVRATLEAVDYQDACRRSRQVSGKALSIQAYNLLPKIRQVDRLIRPDDQPNVAEAHPELAFSRLAGQPLPEPKRLKEGRDLRHRLLSERFGSAFSELMARSASIPTIDLFDACALVATALHLQKGTERRVGSAEDQDSRGLACSIVF